MMNQSFDAKWSSLRDCGFLSNAYRRRPILTVLYIKFSEFQVSFLALNKEF